MGLPCLYMQLRRIGIKHMPLSNDIIFVYCCFGKLQSNKRIFNLIIFYNVSIDVTDTDGRDAVTTDTAPCIPI